MKTCTTCGKEYPDTTKFCPLDGSTLRSKNPNADLVGQVVADRYNIIKKLGEGGMGAVYLGEHVKMGRKSAIKVMNPGMASDPDAISRFNREAANASRISHANVCQIYDFGETAEGIIYLAMEFIEGQALTDLIEKEGALHPTRAASILRQAADGLAAAHDLGMVHRDIKPDNIMIVAGRDGSDIVKVVDFGIAKAVQGDDTSQKVTKTGLVVGTPEYMSPEQLSGDKLDGRSDIYSLALVLYRMLTGVLPFQADSAQETMIKRLTDDPMPLADARPDIAFPPALQAVLDKALARSAADRYASATDFGRDTVAAVSGMALPETRVQAAAESLATQVMDTEAALKQATKYQSATKGKPGGKTSVAPPPAPAKKFPLALAVAAGLAVVVVIGGGAAWMINNNAAADTPSDSTGQIALNTPPGPDTSKVQLNANPTPNNPPRPPRNTTTTTRDTAKGTVPPPNNPPAPVVSITDSLSRMDDLVDAEQWASARQVGMFVWTSGAASGAQKARAARTMGHTYGEQGNSDQMITWYRNSLRYEPNNQAALDILRQMGATP